MPVQKGQSSLYAKLGTKLQEAAEVHRTEGYQPGIQELPAGINNGVAQLEDCKFTVVKEGKQGAGNYIFYAAGVVQTPVAHNGVEVRGMRTQVSEPIYDTPDRSRKTLGEHVGWVQNLMKGFGVGPENLTADKLEATAEALRLSKIYFKFSTWSGSKQILECMQGGKWFVTQDGKKVVGKGPYSSKELAEKANPYVGREPRVNHKWGGITIHDGQLTVEEDLIDNSGESDNNPEGILDESKSAPIAESQSKVAGITDLNELKEAAEGQDPAAQNRLKEMALAAGVDEEDITNASDWQEVIDLIIAGSKFEDEKKESTRIPEVGEVYGYTPLDSKTKKPAVNPKTKAPLVVQVELINISDKTETCHARNLANEKIVYRGIGWDSLISL